MRLLFASKLIDGLELLQDINNVILTLYTTIVNVNNETPTVRGLAADNNNKMY